MTAVAAGLGASAPRAADALVVKSATVVLNPTKGDGFTIKGEFAGLPFAAARVVTFELDRGVTGLQIGELVRKKDRLTWKAPRGTPGLTQLVLDLKKRRFAAKAIGLSLAGLPNPLLVRLGADAGRDCALVRLDEPAPPRRPGAPKARRLKLPRKYVGTPCVVAAPPAADPSAVVVDVPTSVRFEATLAPGAVPDGGGLVLRRLDARGVPVPDVLCTLVDDGGAASGDVAPADGTFACRATVDESALGTLRFVAEAVVGGVAIRSPSVAVYVVPPPTAADLDTVLEVQAQARALWDEQLAALGDTANARQETARRIAALPGVAEAGLSPDGVDIVIRYTSGEIGGLMLSPRFEEEPASAAGDAGPAPSTSGALHQGRAAASTCAPPPPRTFVGTRKALLLKTSYFGAADDWQIAQTTLQASCLDFDVTVGDLTIAGLLGLTQYATVLLSTHGIVGPDGRIGIVTTETASASLLASYRQQFGPDQLYAVGVPAKYTGGGRDVFVVTPRFIAALPGTFDKGLVVASHCWGAFNPSEGAAFRAKGAKTFFSFDNLASNAFARTTTRAIFEDLTLNLLTAGDAYTRTVKVDPTPSNKPPLGKGLWYVRPAPARLLIDGDPRLAYVGQPVIAPERAELERGAQQALSVSVEKAEGCELEYLWALVGDGTVFDGQGGQAPPLFESPRADVTFASDPQALGGETDVTVGVRPPPAGAGERLPFAQTCAVMVVKICGDGDRQEGEECDAGDAADCPGKCRSDCTCQRCGDDIIDPGEICDGANRDVCDAVSPTGEGYCRPDCTSCAVCGDHVVDPNEDCELTDQSACPGACRTNCTCGCSPGDPAGCAAGLCCNPTTKTCCDPTGGGCSFPGKGCCGDTTTFQPCGPPGSPPPLQQCPAPDCRVAGYWCVYCDGKVIDGFTPTP